MSERERISKHMQEHYERLWKDGNPWGFDDSALDAERYARQIGLIADRRYARALDAGCGSGRFTRLLANVCDEVVGIDIAPAAVAQARDYCADKTNVTFRAGDVMDLREDPAGPWDLIVMSETIYCLGWLYPMFDVGWLAHELRGALRQGGRFLLVNTLGLEQDYLLLPWLIRTYRDLFVNLGFVPEREELVAGTKDAVRFEVLMTLFGRGP